MLSKLLYTNVHNIPARVRFGANDKTVWIWCFSCSHRIPANWRRSTNVGLMVDHRLWHWTNIKPPLVQCRVRCIVIANRSRLQFSSNTDYWINAGWMLAHRRPRWPSRKPTSVSCSLGCKFRYTLGAPGDPTDVSILRELHKSTTWCPRASTQPQSKHGTWRNVSYWWASVADAGPPVN